MVKKRYFNDSKAYFKFINKQKDKIEVIMVKPLKKKIRMDYKKLEPKGSV